jgi:hypothetical protein
MAVKAAFLFLSPQGDFLKDRTVLKTPDIELHVIGCKCYQEASEIAKKLLDEKIEVIELCGGFGNLGIAEIVKAIENKIPIGAVRFDIHPALNNSSGDKLFFKD